MGGTDAHLQGNDAYSEQLSPRVLEALAAAEIPPSKLGEARRARLSDPEREFYFWILHRFATDGRPSGADMEGEATRLGLHTEDALAKLACEDLVHLGDDREVIVAYPFSGRPTAHQVRFQSGHEAYAMCAIDALGIAAMFDQPIHIASNDPLSGDAVRVQLAPDGTASWDPQSAVVVAGVIDRSADSFRTCCPALNFFVSAENGECWLARHPQVRGRVMSLPEAVAAGRAVFGAVFA
jgi:Alkylmercury lyase